MGNTKSCRSFLEMKRLEEVTGINRQKFIAMQEESKRKQGTDGSVLVSRADCRHFINQIGVGANNQKQVDAAFAFFEEEGKLSLEQLFSCVVMLSETMDGPPRLSYVIDTHNPKGADHADMSRKYALKVLQCINEFFAVKRADEPEQVWNEICGGTDKPKVTREQFVRYVTSHSPYQDFLV